MQITINSLGAGLSRTVVPLIYAMLIKWGLGGFITETALQDAVAVAITGAIYTAVRYAEQKYPSLGVLIGAKVVTSAPAPQPTVTPTSVVGTTAVPPTAPTTPVVPPEKAS